MYGAGATCPWPAGSFAAYMLLGQAVHHARVVGGSRTAPTGGSCAGLTGIGRIGQDRVGDRLMVRDLARC